MTVSVVKYWPVKKPIPEGWIIVNDLSDCHRKLNVKAGRAPKTI